MGFFVVAVLKAVSLKNILEEALESTAFPKSSPGPCTLGLRMKKRQAGGRHPRRLGEAPARCLGCELNDTRSHGTAYLKELPAEKRRSLTPWVGGRHSPDNELSEPVPLRKTTYSCCQ